MIPDWLSSIAEHARRRPQALAISAAGESLTYGELVAHAQGLAARLAAAGMGRESLVALALPNGLARAAATLAMLQAGAAYLPLSPNDPPGRLESVLWDSGAELLLAPPELAKQLVAGSWSTWAIQGLEDLPAGGGFLPLPTGAPEDLAYVIYTSGSTGAPKGVEIERGALAQLIVWHQSEYQVTPADRASLLVHPAFDAAVWELWPYWAAGASLHVAPPEARLDPRVLRDWLLSERITIAIAATPLAEQLITLPWPAETPLRALLTGGDRLRRHPPAGLPFSLVNHYGPTEATVVTTYGSVPPEGDGLPTIGRPVPYLEVRICAGDLAPVAAGATGELCIAGAALARGYRYAPRLTAERFVVEPATGRRWYRSGDCARWRADGALEFLGRADRQVKIRGWRIEPAEIERQLIAHPAVAAAIVEVAKPSRGDPAADPRLVAYLAACGGERPGLAAMRAYLRSALPEPMLPSEVRWLAEMPQTVQGKWDRAALATAPVLAADDAGEPVAAAALSPTVAALAAILAEALGAESVGPDQDFFLLGGHSLLGVQLIARVREEMGVALPLRAIFDHPTAARLAEEIDRRRAGAALEAAR